MNDQFLQGVIFDWNRIDNDSYLKRIKAFKGIKKLDFNKAITFLVGENGSGFRFGNRNMPVEEKEIMQYNKGKRERSN